MCLEPIKQGPSGTGEPRALAGFLRCLITVVFAFSCFQLLFTDSVRLCGERKEFEEKSPRESVTFFAEKAIASAQTGAGPGKNFNLNLPAFTLSSACTGYTPTLPVHWARLRIRCAPATFFSIDPRLTWESNSGPPDSFDNFLAFV
jgi:hypothetical protein